MARRRTKAERIEQAVSKIIDDARYEANRAELNEAFRAIGLLSSVPDEQAAQSKPTPRRRS